MTDHFPPTDAPPYVVATGNQQRMLLTEPAYSKNQALRLVSSEYDAAASEILQVDFKPKEIEEMREGLYGKEHRYEVKGNGLAFHLVLKPMGTVPRTQTKFYIEITELDAKKTSAEDLFMFHLCIAPSDISRPYQFIFNWFCPKTAIEIKQTSVTKYSYLFGTQPNMINAPNSMAILIHKTTTTKGNGGPIMPHLSQLWLSSDDALGFRNPMSMDSPADPETVQLMVQNKNRVSFKSMNLVLEGNNDTRVSTSLEDATSHCEAIERSLRPLVKSSMGLRFDGFTAKNPKNMQVNCEIDLGIVRLIQEFFLYNRMSRLHFHNVKRLVRAQTLAEQLGCKRLYWALGHIAAVLIPMEQVWEGEDLISIISDALKGELMTELIEMFRDSDTGNVHLFGQLQLFSILAFTVDHMGWLRSVRFPKLSRTSKLLLGQMVDDLTYLATQGG